MCIATASYIWHTDTDTQIQIDRQIWTLLPTSHVSGKLNLSLNSNSIVVPIVFEIEIYNARNQKLSANREGCLCNATHHVLRSARPAVSFRGVWDFGLNALHDEPLPPPRVWLTEADVLFVIWQHFISFFNVIKRRVNNRKLCTSDLSAYV